MVKLQFGCLVIILFIMAVYFSVKRVKTYSHRIFSASLFVSLFYMIFDMITVYTVNHLDTVPANINRICHNIFLESMLAEIFICFLYADSLIHEEYCTLKKYNKIWWLPIIIAMIGVVALPLRYVETPAGNYSWGPAVFMVFFVVAAYIVITIVTLIYHWKKINQKKRFVVLLAYGGQMVISTYQAMHPTVLFTSLGITLINLSFFLTVESPDVHLIERLKEEKQRADEANAAKSTFLSNMSHEIRTPMNAIVGLTEVLLRKEWPQEETGYLLNIKSSGNALLGLINDLLDFSKIESGKFVISEDTYDIAQLLRDIQVIGQNRIQDKNIQLVMDVDANMPRMLYGDALRIRQVIINIMNNAIKFTEQGTVTISAKQTLCKEGMIKLFISVRDTGQGIKQEDMQKLFDAFTQVDIHKNRGKEGSGLGLTISKQLVELMGGTLNLESEYGKGSEFFFTIWQGVRGDEVIGKFSALENNTAGKKAKEAGFTAPDAHILLVEDNKINQKVALAILKPLQMQIDVAENGEQAVDMVRENRYDLVFMDHYMAVMDGVEATKTIRAIEGEYYKELPILALTADAVVGVKERFIEAGMNDFVSKPIDMNMISDKLLTWLPDRLIKRK
ncbi:MAG: response regulator [Lachnospira sp.]|nr:response regulator [Lachnospira sp.]